MALNLRKWLEVSDAYDKGGFAYYTTLPTDCIALFRNAALDLKKYDLGRAKTTFSKLGSSMRKHGRVERLPNRRASKIPSLRHRRRVHKQRLERREEFQARFYASCRRCPVDVGKFATERRLHGSIRFVQNDKLKNVGHRPPPSSRMRWTKLKTSCYRRHRPYYRTTVVVVVLVVFRGALVRALGVSVTTIYI